MIILLDVANNIHYHMPDLISSVENMVSNSDVDHDGQELKYPYWDVVGVEANKTPVSPDPTPELQIISILVKYEWLKTTYCSVSKYETFRGVAD